MIKVFELILPLFTVIIANIWRVGIPSLDPFHCNSKSQTFWFFTLLVHPTTQQVSGISLLFARWQRWQSGTDAQIENQWREMNCFSFWCEQSLFALQAFLHRDCIIQPQHKHFFTLFLFSVDIEQYSRGIMPQPCTVLQYITQPAIHCLVQHFE